MEIFRIIFTTWFISFSSEQLYVYYTIFLCLIFTYKLYLYRETKRFCYNSETLESRRNLGNVSLQLVIQSLFRRVLYWVPFLYHDILKPKIMIWKYILYMQVKYIYIYNYMCERKQIHLKSLNPKVFFKNSMSLYTANIFLYIWTLLGRKFLMKLLLCDQDIFCT